MISEYRHNDSHLKTRFEEAYSQVTALMGKELPSYYTYHNLQHTKDVVQAARYLAEAENLPAGEMYILLTAALLHDTGFIKGHENHEEQSCELAQSILPEIGYNEHQVEAICELIMATKLPHNPVNQLQQILCDADLFYLGTNRFFISAENLFLEYKHTGIVKDYKEWQAKQLQFLYAHRFFTKTAIKEKAKKKKQHLRQLQETWNKQYGEKKSPKFFSEYITDFSLMILGVVTAGFALKGFLVPNHFFDGGVTGISLLIQELYHFNLAYVIVIANIPLILLGYKTIGKKFAWKTLISVLLLGVCLLLVPYPLITSDKLLISIFGGFFLGIGIGLTMRAGCALDGVEVLALLTFKRTPFTVTEIVLAINVFIFCVAAVKLGMETALYSILTYFTASKTIDYVVEGVEAYTGVTIISGQSDLLKHRLVNELGRGITVYKGERGFLPGQFESSSDCDIIFTVVTRLELRRLKNLVYETDPKAFVFANSIREASGGILSRKESHS